MRTARGLAIGLLFAAGAASANLCDGPCAIVLDFADGGSLASDGATITFGTGGALTLGTGGTLTLGTGGSLTPDTDPPDMSAGGTLVLGDGGSIQFGTGGLLDTAGAGNINLGESTALAVTGAAGVSVDAAQSVHLGNLTATGTASLTAAGTIDDGDATSPIHFDSTGDITVASDADITYATVTAGVVELNTPPAGGGGFSDCSAGCPAGGTSTLGSPTIPSESNLLGPQTPGAGGLGLPILLPLALAAGLRPRRRR